VRFLVDECLHTSLLDSAHKEGHAADHVNYLGLGGFTDRKLMAVILGQDYTFVTNNRSDFLTLYGNVTLQAGLIVIVPNVNPDRQRRLFEAALKHIGQRQIVNTVIEVTYYQGANIRCHEYSWP